MIDMNTREFQRGFCKLRDGFEKIRVTGRGGEIVGEWHPTKTLMSDMEVSATVGAKSLPGIPMSDNLSDNKRDKFEKLKKNLDMRSTPTATDHYQRDDEVEEVPDEECFVCKKASRIIGAWSGRDLMNDEQFDRPICLRCARSVSFIGVKLN